MNRTTYLLIGGGVAGSHAAKELRQQDPEAAITLVTNDPHRPYDRPPLSKDFLRGDMPLEKVFFDDPSFYETQNMELKLGVGVKSLDAARKTATLDDGSLLRFDKALIATGGRPIHLPIPGADLPGVHYLRTLNDSMALAAAATPGAFAVVIGAGFIGLEVAASLAQRGVEVTVVETASHIWPRFAHETLAAAIQDHCAAKSIAFRTAETVTEIQQQNERMLVRLRSGAQLPCHFVCIGVGIQLNVELAREAGLAVDNGLVVNEYLQSSRPDIFAAGDVANFIDPLFGKRRRVEHWGHAEYSGQLAARNMAGAGQPYDLLTYVWSDIFDLHLEFAGDETEHDQMLLRGKLDDLSCIFLYLKQQRLTAYFAINANNKDLPPLQKLIKRRQDLSGKENALQDPASPLKSLLTPQPA